MLGSLAADAPHPSDAEHPPAVTVSAGGCSASPLPVDASCAATARQLFRAAATGIGLPDETIYDGVTMASELAANSRHARAAVQFDGVLGCPVAGAPELWLYLRRAAGQQELVCKVFDALPGWKNGQPPDPPPGPQAAGALAADTAAAAALAAEQESGRGLCVVAALSTGRWGHHLTRARLGGWKVPGKVVWFAQPVPPGAALGRFRRTQPGSLQAATRLERMLADRGLGHIVRADAPASGMSVLSIRRGLTVWVRSRVVSWTSRSGGREWREFSDLVDATEQIVRAHEELVSADAG